MKTVFQLMHEESQKAAALRRLNQADWTYPADGAWKYTEPVTAQALDKVDAIRDQALALESLVAALSVRYKGGDDRQPRRAA